MKRFPLPLAAALLLAFALAAPLRPIAPPDGPVDVGRAEGQSRPVEAADASASDCAASILLPLPPAVALSEPCTLPASTLEDAEGLAGASGSSTLGFQNIVIPGATDAGEPTIGVTPEGNVFFQEGIRTWKSPDGGQTWAVVAMLPPEFLSIDPVLWVDPVTGRVFVTHLYGACSHTWMSDDEGAGWTYVPATCGTPGNDHPKLATGPFATPPAGGAILYPNAAYYCYNGVAYTACALSATGGLSWQPAVPLPCGGGLAGHPHVAGDGAVYVPLDHCGGFNAAAVSRNNGLTWTTSSTSATGLRAGVGIEPDMASTPDGTLYMAATVDGPGESQLPYGFLSTDGGASWTAHDLAGTTGVQSIVFPVVAAGNDGRAAIAFHGALEAKPPGQVSSTTAWHLYVAVTYDAGATWTTVKATPDTPKGPVQRGPICLNGLSCGANRNLLEFMDIALDEDGYILVGYADGCIHTSCANEQTSEAAQGTVARQTLGQPLR